MHAIKIRAWWTFLIVRKTVLAFVKDSGVTWSAATAFYLVLSVPPLLIAFTSIGVAVVGEQTARQFVSERVSQFLPSGSSQLQSVVNSTVSGFGPTAIVSLSFLLVSGTRVFAALARAINQFWSHVDDAGWLRRQVSRFLLLVVVGGLLASSIALEIAAAVISKDAKLPWLVGWALRSQVLPAVLVFLGLFATYLLLPHGAARWRTAATGALVGTILLRLAQFFFTLFIRTFGNFQSAYGPLATVAILMTWALIASGAILLAAELVAVLDRQGIPGRKRPTDQEHGAAAPGRSG